MTKNYKKFYFNVIDHLKEKYRQKPFPYKDKTMIKKLGLVNKQCKEYNDNWYYQKHHIIEIDVSGATLKNDKERNDNELAIVCNIEEHAFLHYLIVCNQSTKPNHGFLLMMNLEQWDNAVKKLCQEYNVPYDKDWKTKLTCYKAI